MNNIHQVNYKNVSIQSGFWKRRQDINRNTTAFAVYNRFSDTHRFEALKCLWKEGMPNRPHIFWDSDVAKWIEGVAYILHTGNNEELEALADTAIDDIARNQDPQGYFNSHFLVTEQEKRFCKRNDHELYCAGHLIEAGCAYYLATGKDKLLNVIRKYADYIYDIFYVQQSAEFAVCGHPEIELALVRLAETTKCEKYLELARFFVDLRGNNGKDLPIVDWVNMYYDQSHMPLKEQETAEGHAVRALYTYCAMADIALHYRDEAYFHACEKLFNNIVEKRMYITGATGSTYLGEAFTVDYDLPNKTAYAETCAAIALGLFARRMLKLTVDSRYSDAVERIWYNGMLAGISLDGRSFFYENPLEVDPRFNSVNTSTVSKAHTAIMERVEVFDCSCCPPNLIRYIASLGDDFYSYQGDTVFVHQYAQSHANINGNTIIQYTSYPADGEVRIAIQGKAKQIAVRIPGWCDSFTLSEKYTIKKGYAYMLIPENREISIRFEMPVQLMESNGAVQDNAGRAAVMRGPVVYCLESIDNGNQLRSLALKAGNTFEEEYSQEYGVPLLKTKGLRKIGSDSLYAKWNNRYEETPIKLIPYYARANRGITEMIVWITVK